MFIIGKLLLQSVIFLQKIFISFTEFNIPKSSRWMFELFLSFSHEGNIDNEVPHAFYKSIIQLLQEICTRLGITHEQEHMDCLLKYRVAIFFFDTWKKYLYLLFNFVFSNFKQLLDLAVVTIVVVTGIGIIIIKIIIIIRQEDLKRTKDTNNIVYAYMYHQEV